MTIEIHHVGQDNGRSTQIFMSVVINRRLRFLNVIRRGQLQDLLAQTAPTTFIDCVIKQKDQSRLPADFDPTLFQKKIQLWMIFNMDQWT